MTCCHYYAIAEGHESAFSVDISSIVFGPGVLKEAGEHARALGMRRAALFTDERVGALECVADALASLRAAGVDVEIYDEVRVEPTDASFLGELVRYGRTIRRLRLGGRRLGDGYL